MSHELRIYHGKRLLLMMLPRGSISAVVEELRGDRRLRWVCDDIACTGKVVIECEGLCDVVEEEAGELTEPVLSWVRGIKGKARAVAPERERRIKVPEGAVTIAQIAEGIGMDVRDARAVLRKGKVAKPYAWVDTAAIVAMLKKSR